MEDFINHLRTVERCLINGCTYAELREAACVSDKTARRIVATLRKQGCVINETIGWKNKVTLKMKKSTRLFRA